MGDATFTKRLARHYDELKWLYMEVYHDQKAFDYFVKMLEEYYDQREQHLKDLDTERVKNPGWYKGNNMLGMLMYTNCFAGTLQGVKSHLDYVKETGVNYIHLMPLLESPKGRDDGGYAVSDFRRVKPELGTMEDLADLSRECHSRGMSVCLDFVMNHTSEDHEWAMRAKAGDPEYQARYYFFDDWNIPSEFERTVPQVFPTTAPGNFSWNQETQKVVMTTFYPYQWDLNYYNPVVFNDMTSNMLNLCNHGVDIIRLDAVPYIWKELGTKCRNLPKVHTLVRIMRLAGEIVCPGMLLLGEVVMEPKEVVPYFGTIEKPEHHMLYNVTTMASTWHTVATRDVRLLRHQLDTVFALPKDYTFLNYLRCHDDIGWGLDYKYLQQFGMEEIPHKKFLNDHLTGADGSDARGELYNNDPRLGDARLTGMTASLVGVEAAEYEGNSEKLDRAIRFDIMLHAFLFTQSGIPVLYSGDEIGQLNDYTYHDDPLKADDSRYLHRGNLSWDAVARRNTPGTTESRLYHAIRSLAKLRTEYKVFDSLADAWTIDTYNDHILGIGRYYQGQKLIALFNFSENDETAWINEPEDYVDLITGEHREAKAVGVPAQDFAWLYFDYNQDSKPSRKLLFVDIDGTLTVAGENVPPKSALQAIKETQAKGNLVFLCTGRNLGMLAPLLKYGFDGVIGCGGGIVKVGDEIIYDMPMEPEQRDELMEVLKRNGVFRTIESRDVTYGDENLGDFLNSTEEGNSEIERWRKALSSQLGIRPMSEYDGRPIYKVVIMCERPDQLDEAREKFEKDFAFAIQDVKAHNCQNGDLVNRKFDKGQAIQRVCEYLGQGLEDTYGFGDSMNDLEMIETVGTSVVMANGSEKLKKLADVIAPRVENGGLYKVFKKLGLI